MAYQPKTRNCNSNLYVVGHNTYGQLGLNHTNYIEQLTQYNNDSIDVARIHVGDCYCIFESSYVNKYYSAGYNYYGQCAVGSFDDKIPKCRHIEYFNKINKNIKKIFVTNNSNSVFWLTTNNEIYANGYNKYYNLGINNNDNQSKPSIVIALKDIKDIQSGYEHSVAMDKNGNVYGAGRDEWCGSMDKKTSKGGWNKIMFFKNKQIKQIKCGGAHTLFLSADSCLYAAGDNHMYGQLGQGDCAHYDKKGPVLIGYFTTNYISVKDICCGMYHNLAIDDKCHLYAWGYNRYGQCGINKSSNILSPQLVQTLKTENITKIQCGAHHSCVCSMERKYFMFGCNEYNKVSLEEQKEDKIFLPKYINGIVSEITNGKQIKNVCLGNRSTFIFVSDSIQYGNNEEEKCNDSDEKKEESAPIYKTMRKAKRKYDETTKSGKIKVAVGNIVCLIIADIGAYATGGTLLAKQLKNTVVDVSWSKSKTNEDIVEHFYHNNTYFLIELKRKVEKHGFNFFGITAQEFKIAVEVKWFYFEANNISAKNVLVKLASDQATDAFDYVSEFGKKWS